jgi:hypothetical protein
MIKIDENDYDNNRIMMILQLKPATLEEHLDKQSTVCTTL